MDHSTALDLRFKFELVWMYGINGCIHCLKNLERSSAMFFSGYGPMESDGYVMFFVGFHFIKPFPQLDCLDKMSSEFHPFQFFRPKFRR